MGQYDAFGSCERTYKHRMTSVAEENDSVVRVYPSLERFAIHESPFQCRLHVREKSPNARPGSLVPDER